MPLRLSRRATADLDDIYTYGADRWGEAQAERYLAAFWHAADLIETHPFAMRERRETALPVRVARFGSHLIIYQVREKEVLVIRVAHGRSDWPSTLD